MHQTVGIGTGGLPWKLFSPADYNDACDGCETWLTLSGADRADVLESLVDSDRVLSVDVEGLGLKKGDCLVPTLALPDISELENVACPVHVCFWRPENQTLSSRRNPLFDPGTYITLDCICLDILHTLHLGVVMRFVSECWWHLINHNAWGVPDTTKEAKFEACVGRLRVDLFAWYKKRRAKDPQASVSELNQFTAKMIGAEGSGYLATKGHETKWLLAFTAEEMQIFVDSVPQGQAYLDGAVSLWDHMKVLSNSSSKMNASERGAYASVFRMVARSDRLNTLQA